MADASVERREVADGLVKMLEASGDDTDDSYRRIEAPDQPGHRRRIDRQELMNKLRTAPMSNPTVDRLADWDRRRAERQRVVKEETAAAEVEQCTFHPTISKFAESKEFATGDVVDRLQHRAKLAEERRKKLLARAEELVKEECTFNPEIHTSPIQGRDHHTDATSDSYAMHDDIVMLEYVPVEERTTQARVHHMLASDWRTRSDPECTFRPTISPVADEVYSVARTHEAHLSVFDRLFQRSQSNRRRSASPRREGSKAIEGEDAPETLPAELMTELTALRRHFAAPASGSDEMLNFYCNVLGTSNPQPVADALNLSGSSESSESSITQDDVRYVRFNDFIMRQNNLELRRRAAIERVRAETASTFQPPICGKSLELVKVARQRGRQPSHRKSLWDEPTFKPVISSASAKHRGRSTDDMLRDAQRLEAHREQLRMAKEKAEAQLHPFKPQLGTTAKQYPGIQSMLAVDNINKLSERLKVKQEARRSKELAARQSKLDQEVAACTFAPKLNAVPSYISDMARSAHVLRDALFV